MGLRSLEAGARRAERAGRDVDPPAVEAPHRDLEALALRADAVVDRHAAVLEDHHRGRLRVPAELLLLRAEAQPGRAPLDHDAADAARALAAGAHHAGVDVGRAGARDERLAAVQHVVDRPARAARVARLGRVRAGARLGQAVAGEALHGHQIGQPARALLVRRRRRRSSRRPCCGSRCRPRSRCSRRRAPRRRSRHRGATARRRRRPRARRCRRSRARPPRAASSTGNRQLLVPLGRMRRQLLGGERARHVLERALLLAQLEVHARSPLLQAGSGCGDQMHDPGRADTVGSRSPRLAHHTASRSPGHKRYKPTRSSECCPCHARSTPRSPRRFPTTRLRRNRRDAWSRRLVAEARLDAADLIWPVFVAGRPEPARAGAVDAGRRAAVGRPAAARCWRRRPALGIPAVALFPVTPPELKSARRRRGDQSRQSDLPRGAGGQGGAAGARRDLRRGARSLHHPRPGRAGRRDG